MSSFCDGCENAWSTKKIMSCKLCAMHISNGWSIEQLMHVYGERRKLYQQIGLTNVFPPSSSRPYFPKQKNRENEIGPVSLCYTTKYSMLPKSIQIQIDPVLAETLKKMHKEENKLQKQFFVQQELRVIREINLASTTTLRQQLYDILDPMTQAIYNLQITTHK